MGHDTILATFVVIAALALLAQAVIFYGIFEALRRIERSFRQTSSGTIQRLEDLSQAVTNFLSESREPVRTITANLAGITTMLRERSMHVDAVLAEVVDRSRDQIIRFDQTLTAMMAKVETTADAVGRGVLAPINEVSAIAKGVQRGLEFLFSRRRAASASEPHHDEQMFI